MKRVIFFMVKTCIRRAKLSDYPAILKVQKDSYGLVVWNWFDLLVERLFRADEFLIICDDTIVGFIHARRQGLYKRHFLNSCVIPEYEGKGVATQAFLLVMAHYVGIGVTTLTCETSVQNKRALRLFTGLGFEQNGIVPHYYRTYYPNSDALRMVKSLR